MKLFINSTKSVVTFNKQDYLLRAAERLGLDNVLPLENELNPMCVLNVEPYDKFIRGTKWTGIWEIDLLCDRAETNLSDWLVANKVFIAVSKYSSRLNGAAHKTELLFQAIDPQIHKRIESIPQEYDFVCCGSLGLDIYKERERLINLLKKEFSCNNYGKGHNPYVYIQNLNHAKVQFIRSMNTQIADGELAQRFFECLAIGPVLTNYVDDLKETKLKEGVDYLSYRNDEELLEKMNRLIDNKTYADYIAENGRKKALELHTYDLRLQHILKDLI